MVRIREQKSFFKRKVNRLLYAVISNVLKKNEKISDFFEIRLDCL